MRRIGFKKKFLLVFLGAFLVFIFIETVLTLYSNFYTKQHLPRYELRKSLNSNYNILCLGDSFTYGIGAGFKNSYPAQLEEILNSKNPEMRAKVFNLGVPGYNSSEVVIKLAEVIQTIKPQMVIILSGENDLWSHKNGTWEKLPLGLKIKVFLAKLRCFRFCSIFFENSRILLSKRAEDIAPADPSAANTEIAAKLLEKANNHRRNKKYTQAKQEYKKALANDPLNKTILIELGRCYKLNSEYKKAFDVFINLLRLNPEDEKVLAEIKDLAIKQDHCEKTLELYSILFDIYPDNQHIRKELFNAYVHSAGIFLLTNQFHKSLRCYEKAIELFPENREVILSKKMVQDFLARYNNLPLNEVVFESFAKNNILISPYMYRKIILADNLEKIISLCKKNDITLVLSGYPLSVSDIVREKAKLHGISLVEHQETFNSLLEQAPKEKYFVSIDDNHCTKAGYYIMAENIASLILKVRKDKAL